MKKQIIISALALCFALVNVNANSVSENLKKHAAETVLKVNPFCMSIAKGDLETVIKLINLGADVNQKSNGMTPAMYAAKFNRCKILKLLINNGAKLKVKSDKGITAKKYAERSNAKEAKAIIVETLKKKK